MQERIENVTGHVKLPVFLVLTVMDFVVFMIDEYVKCIFSSSSIKSSVKIQRFKMATLTV